MAGLQDPEGVEQAGRIRESLANARLDRHFLYLYVISAFLGLGVGS